MFESMTGSLLIVLLIGGILAVGVAWILRGQGGGIRGKMAAQGDVKLDVSDPSMAPKDAPPE